MLDAEAPVARAILALHLFEVIQQNVIRLVADGMYRALQSRAVGIANIFLERAFGKIENKLGLRGGRRPDRGLWLYDR